MKLPVKDIHNHLLPGVDDGFHNTEDSLRAIEKMAEAGVKEFVFTPHINPDVYPDLDERRLKQVYESFTRVIPEQWSIKTSLAAEYMVTNGFGRCTEQPDSLLCQPDGSILIEMSFLYKSVNIEQAVFELVMAGLQPILAHPERYLYMSSDLGWFEHVKDMGCRLQLNCLSLSGCYGPSSMKILTHLLKNGMYDFIATDLHTLEQLQIIQGMRLSRKLSRNVEILLSSVGINAE